MVLKEEVNKYAKNELLVVSFCNKLYKRIALNWVAYLKKLNIENYVIVSADRETEKFLLDNNINTIYIRGTLPRQSKKGWRWRTEQLSRFLNCGCRIIHSDLDTAWLKNPFHLISKNYDAVFSRDLGGYPKEVHEKWGFCVCPGWMYLTPTASIQAMFISILDENQINRYMCSRISKENIVELIDESSELRSNSFNAKVLGNSIIERYGYVTDYCYVYHPHMRKNADCETQLKKKGFWIYD
jgi:hypothetical protein